MLKCLHGDLRIRFSVLYIKRVFLEVKKLLLFSISILFFFKYMEKFPIFRKMFKILKNMFKCCCFSILENYRSFENCKQKGKIEMPIFCFS